MKIIRFSRDSRSLPWNNPLSWLQEDTSSLGSNKSVDISTRILCLTPLPFCAGPPTKDFVSDSSFAILRGTTNGIVGSVMDQVMPELHSYSAQFKLSARIMATSSNPNKTLATWLVADIRPRCL
jgi:hypothetical protein